VNKKSNRCNSMQIFIHCKTTPSSFAVNKYLHTVASVGFFIHIYLFYLPSFSFTFLSLASNITFHLPYRILPFLAHRPMFKNMEFEHNVSAKDPVTEQREKTRRKHLLWAASDSSFVRLNQHNLVSCLTVTHLISVKNQMHGSTAGADLP